MKKVTIGDRVVGEGKPCFIIAEAGSNHNGKLEQAKRLIDVAADAKADAVKFQTFSVKTHYSKYAPGFTYLEDQDIYQLIKKLELPRTWHKELSAYAHNRGIIFLSTPSDYSAVDELDQVGMPAFKIASFEIVDLELLKYVARKEKPMVISTGMANLGEIEDAINAVKSMGNEQIILLHCNSLYPTPSEVVNLKAIETMKTAFGLPVGFSDHTQGIHVAIAAVARGAHVIEKHFTLDKSMQGPDHSFALEPHELKQMIQSIRDVEKSMGSGIKDKSALESEEMYTKARRSIHAKSDILKGEKITKDLLIIKRPGFGIKPKFIEHVIGKSAKTDIREDEWITWDKIE